MSTSLSAQAFGQHIEGIGRASFENDVERRKALLMARSLCHRLEKPMDTMLRVGWIETTDAPILKIAIDMGLYQALGNDPDRPVAVEQLSKATESDPVLMKRLLRLLAAMDVVAEVDEDRYAATELSIALQDRSVNSAIDFRFMFQDAFRKLPTFLKQTGYQNPKDSSAGPWQFGTGENSKFFNWLLENPDALEVMSSHMSGYTKGRETWESIYPVHDRILRSIEGDKDVILVDVGGGVGHDLRRFSSNMKLDNEGDRLVLQDLPAVVGQASGLPSSVKPVPLDFFQDSPVVGARAYYLHSVLHDWPDRETIMVLEKMKPALRMRKDGYKPKLLLNEHVLPKTGLKELIAAQDWFVLVAGASQERTREQWTELLAGAGYKLTEIFSKEHVDEAIIEAELVED